MAVLGFLSFMVLTYAFAKLGTYIYVRGDSAGDAILSMFMFTMAGCTFTAALSVHFGA